MYNLLRLRYRTTLEGSVALLEDMALGPSSPHMTRAKTPTSASSPSLRSRDPVIIPMTPPPNMDAGGNVKVVVRVRGFLPRGTRSFHQI